MMTGHAHVSASAVHSIEAALHDIQDGYQTADWGRVRHQFTSPVLGRRYVDELSSWQTDSAGDLHVDLIATAAGAHGVNIATVRFSGDPRAMPRYAVFLFQTANGRSHIVGTISGISGTSYTNARWAISRTKHFIVYHSPYQLQGADRRGLADLEYQRAQFVRRFHLHPAPLAAYYLYPEQRLIAKLTDGRCGSNPDNVGCTFQGMNPPTIHASEWVSFHEPIHVYQTVMEPKGYTAPLFIAEGMAVALEDRDLDPRKSDYCSQLTFVPLDSCARYAFGTTNPMSILSDQGFNRADAGNAYSLGGSFVKYLILHYGYSKFGRFYYVLAAQPKDRQQDYDVASRKVYGAPIAQLISTWRDDVLS